MLRRWVKNHDESTNRGDSLMGSSVEKEESKSGFRFV
jgi:hypothetical protein